MKILFVASELAPWAKVGGLGDVIGGLPKALAKLGADVSAVLPFYREIRRKNVAKKKIGALSVRLAREFQRVNVYEARAPKSRVKVFLLENKKYLSRGPIYFERTAFAGSFREIQRFLFFSRAVYELLSQNCADRTQNYAKNDAGLRKFALSPRLSADVVHCNDWHTGALASLLRANGSNLKARTVFTIHNLANQGVWDAREVKRWYGKNPFRQRGSSFNFMAEGIESAGVATTVSPSYAKEILSKQYGAGLEKPLLKRSRQKKLVGILNGIDYADWPLKKRGKKRFQKELGLGTGGRFPIMGLVARLTYQKGINLIAQVAPRFIKKHGAQFVFLGQGEENNEKALKALARKYPKNVYAKIGFDAELARKIYSQSDFFLMPSLFEPSGLGQMISMRYGTVPIARATGGLKDSVINKKTGFVFRKFAPQALAEAMKGALRLFSEPKKFNKLAANCKKQDFGWRKSARKYLDLYRKIARN